MPRVKRGTTHVAKRKKLLSRTKGSQGQAKKLIRRASESDLKAGHHAYVDRRKHKRDMRKLWSVRINAAARAEGLNYSKLISGLKAKNIKLDRKVLADLAMNHPEVFKKVAETVK